MAEKTQKAKSDKPAKGGKAPAEGKKGKKGAEAAGGGASARASRDSGQVSGPGGVPRLRTHYEGKVIPALKEQFQYKNPMQVPKLEKIVLNIGVGDAVQNPKLVDAAVSDLQQITGQKPVIRRARKSIANFKLREGQAIGCSVTLRGNRMYEFYDRLVSVVLPRIRDFRGVPPKSFDGRGNYNMGVTEQVVFPEIDYDKIEKVRGLDITIVTTARTDEEGRELLRLMQLPFRTR